ncbi:interferon-induced helicase C domain-containing protein 1-like, partial [Actinia tenebrosa]|uniref:RNA helicase n=1 Tax=Actinia tenebrosa TaxID=6105 RepID=A0A6P8ITD3_ACTTE
LSICFSRCEDLRGEIRGPKVVFIVSTQNLVLQQRTRFEEYLTDYSICDISGSNSTEIPLDFLLKTHDVVILTAQILLNALVKNNLEISHITLLIFDECHHTNKDHAYNKIMQNYMAIKYLVATEDRKLPQILGLTASLGVGKSTESGKAKNHILKICANMDAACVSTVNENTEELEKNVTGGVPKRRMEQVDQVANTFEKVITQIMGKIEKAAERYYDSSNGVPADRVGQQYRQWVEGLYKDAIGRGNRDLVTYAQQLRRYHVSLIINDTVRIKDAMKYLDEFFDSMDETKFQETDRKLRELFQKAKKAIESRLDKEPINPKLQKLKDLILKFHEEDKEKGRKGETKGILFTRTRDSTVGILGWISDTKELKEILKPKPLVGAGDGEVGMTQGEQEAIIEEFKKGEVNILIATTVAEEGLDIGDCNFVIRYNMAGNEISSVQSRGRIRADEGNYVYLGDKRSRGVHREQLNQYREILMASAVSDVQQMSRDEYKKKIESIQKKDVQNIKMKSILSAKKKRGDLQCDDVTFFCRRCNKMACQLNQFRRLKDTFHVILDKTFVDEKVQLKPRKRSKKIDDILIENKVHCKECDEDWGTTVKIDGCTWPCLKITAFAVEYPQSKRNMYKKWSEFPIEIPEAQLSELLQNDESLDLDLDDMNFDFE